MALKDSYNFLGRVNNAVYAPVNYINGFRVNYEKSLVINGFWRSGTTWLQEIVAAILEAKTVFEPFQARAAYIFRCLQEIRPRRQDYRFVNALMPYASGRLKNDTVLYSIIQRSLRGQLNQRHVVRKLPQSLTECLRPSVITKFTRGALCLRAIANTFPIPIIHITRDPRAVIASIKKGKQVEWGERAFEGAFHDFSLHAHLLEVDDGRREYFQRWKSDIEAIEKTDDYGRLAGYYCLTEHYLEDSFIGVSGKFTKVHYETLVTAGFQTIVELLKDLGLEPRVDCPERFAIPSSTDYHWSKSRKNVLSDARLFSWKSKLSEREQRIIEEVVAVFGMQKNLWQ